MSTFDEGNCILPEGRVRRVAGAIWLVQRRETDAKGNHKLREMSAQLSCNAIPATFTPGSQTRDDFKYAHASLDVEAVVKL